MKAHYAKARIVYTGLIPESVLASAEGALVPTLDTPSIGHIEHFELNPFKVVGFRADPDKWPQPAHVALANWSFDSVERCCAFTRQYGALHITGQTVTPENLKSWQDNLRSFWRAENGYLWEAFRPRIEGGEVLIEIGDLWPYISFLAQADRHEGLLAVCPNDNSCPLPYFKRERSDQRFCSVECRNLFNVRRWRSNPKNAVRERKLRMKREREQR